MRRTAVAFAAVVPGLLVLTACQDPAYEPAAACSIPADTVAAIMGTDRFSAPDRRLEALPFTDASLTAGGSGACRIDAGDDSLTVKALIIPSTEAPRRAAEIEAGGDSFDLLGGVARADGKDAGWACGSVWLTANLSGDRSADPADMRAALESLAQEATCYRAPERPWDPQD